VPLVGKPAAEHAGNESSRQHAMGNPDLEEGLTAIPFIHEAKLESLVHRQKDTGFDSIGNFTKKYQRPAHTSGSRPL